VNRNLRLLVDLRPRRRFQCKNDHMMGGVGAIPGVEIGRWFPSRRACHEAGVHRPLQAGICGTGQTGAESIVVSGGYDDDEDYGTVILYTGHGGRDPNTGRQVADQSLDDPGDRTAARTCPRTCCACARVATFSSTTAAGSSPTISR